MIVKVTRTVVEKVEIPDEDIIKYAKEDINFHKQDKNFDFIEYISECGNGSLEGYCEALLDKIGYDEMWEKFDSREEIFEAIDGYNVYMDSKDKNAAIVELVELIKGEK